MSLFPRVRLCSHYFVTVHIQHRKNGKRKEALFKFVVFFMLLLLSHSLFSSWASSLGKHIPHGHKRAESTRSRVAEAPRAGINFVHCRGFLERAGTRCVFFDGDCADIGS